MYSDAGLLGAMVVCEAASAGKVVGAVAAALRSAQASQISSVFESGGFIWLRYAFNFFMGLFGNFSQTGHR